MVSAVVALLRYRVTAVTVVSAVTVVTASAADRNIPIWLPPRRPHFAAGYDNNGDSGGTGGSGEGKSSMRDNSFGGGS